MNSIALQTLSLVSSRFFNQIFLPSREDQTYVHGVISSTSIGYNLHKGSS